MQLVLQDDTSTDAGEDGQSVLSGREIRKMLRCGAKNILASREKLVGEVTGMDEGEIDKIITEAKELGSLLAESKTRDQEEEEEEESNVVDVMELELFETRQVRFGHLNPLFFFCIYRNIEFVYLS
jgi:hypothetical protein